MITFRGMDDGSRVTVFNSRYPNGEVVPGSYVYLHQNGTTNLKELMVTGENRVVVTQVDDCCENNRLSEANVVINSVPIPPSTEPSCDTDTLAPCWNGVCFQNTRGNTTCNPLTNTCQCRNPSHCVYNVKVPLAREWRVCRGPEDPEIDQLQAGTAVYSPLTWTGLLVRDVFSSYATATSNSFR